MGKLKNERNEAEKVLNEMVKFCDNGCLSAGGDRLHQFVSDKVAFNQTQVFIRLQLVGRSAPRLLGSILPLVEAEVARIEMKRGAGQDKKLRQHMKDLGELVSKSQ